MAAAAGDLDVGEAGKHVYQVAPHTEPELHVEAAHRAVVHVAPPATLGQQLHSEWAEKELHLVA